ncbi:3-keto-5-aminohexanoate cleavage protein [Roseiterribacter gracilis]|uniref:3-keto-5-aminohexanoate cleavage protein n=1 Tax=Roseiterribacter gracilis TaxID=2812848 RepID=A0A8S8X9V3_9PROT|nr:3-keto-5-aminohexanoate cleavage protein [Rhodospirillales bacterium TMPK1]
MRKADKVIITCAVTGSIHTPSMSDALPITPDQIAEQSIAAAEAGAAILHLHARQDDGRPTADPEVFMQFLPRIKQSTNAVVNITTGGAMGMSIDDRLAAPRRAQPELCSLNMGSMNFGVFAAAEKITDWKHAWEKDYLAQSYDLIAPNTFKQIEMMARDLGDRFGTKFEFECYDVGHLYTLRYFADLGVVKPPFFIQCIFGVLGGQGADPDNLVHMKNTADKLFGDEYYMSVLATGRFQTRMVTMSALYGGNVRVGLEDSLFLQRGKMAPDNASQVKKIRTILEELSFEIATPDEARTMLGLKGGDQVAF